MSHKITETKQTNKHLTGSSDAASEALCRSLVAGYKVDLKIRISIANCVGSLLSTVPKDKKVFLFYLFIFLRVL